MNKKQDIKNNNQSENKIKNTAKLNFMKLTEENSGKSSYFKIIPIAYEGDVSYGKGASKGPEEIIKASENLEYYDEEFLNQPFINGIETLETTTEYDKIKIEPNNFFPIAIGGDHSISIPLIQDLNEDVSIIIFDSHPDMFHSWNNSQKNHRCVAQRASDRHKVLIIGVRSMDKDEEDIIKSNDNVEIIKKHKFNLDILRKQLEKLEKKVYISIDVDVFDCSFIRNTGTPEPGGFFWDDIIEALKIIFSEKEVVGSDIVEFAPEINFRAEAYSLAKLCHKLMAMKMKYN
jgi:agmatinase